MSLSCLPHPAAVPWPDPVPLENVPAAAPFPTDVLPAALGRLVREAAAALNCPEDAVGVPVLALGGGALGNARHLALTPSHTQPPLLYAAVVSPPGAVKSPPLKLLRQPFHRLERHSRDLYRASLPGWERWPPILRGPRPVLRRCIVGDTTTECLGSILGDNPRGVVMVRDDLTALVASLNPYKASRDRDRQLYLALWGGDPLVIDRKSDRAKGEGPVLVEEPFAAIVGTVSPAVLDRLRGAGRGGPPGDGGFLDRFLLVYPPPRPAVAEQWQEVPSQALAAWETAVERLLDLTMTGDAAPRPVLVGLTACGRAAWQRFTQAHADEVNAETFPPHLQAAWAMLRAYGARLALIVHCLRRACGEKIGEDVDGESMERAGRLVAYFKAHALRVRALLACDPRMEDARRVLRWLRTEGRRRFQKREAYHALKRTFATVADLEPVLSLLEQHALIRAEPRSDSPGPGRKPSPYYEVHPGLAEAAPPNALPEAVRLAGGAGTPVNSGDSGDAFGKHAAAKMAAPEDPVKDAGNK
jgi:hypothetical protein